MKKNEIIKTVNAYSAILRKLQNMQRAVILKTELPEPGNDTPFDDDKPYFNLQLIAYLDEHIKETKTELIDFIKVNL